MSSSSTTKTSLTPAQLNTLAQTLKSLHIPSSPLLLANVHDASSASAIASHPSTTALATASYAIAQLVGVSDDQLTLPLNLAGISYVAAGLRNAGKSEILPLSADLQDGYADPAETVRKAIELGVVGCNLEDCITTSLTAETEVKLRSLEESVARIKSVLSAAREAGVPDFVVNARTDVWGLPNGGMEEVLRRGKAYLDAGATSVFVWGVGRHEITEEEVRTMVDAFQGRLAVQPGIIGTKRLRELGVARISVGPALWRKAIEVVREEGGKVLEA